MNVFPRFVIRHKIFLQLADPQVTSDEKSALRKLLWHPFILIHLNDFIDTLAVAYFNPETIAAISAAGADIMANGNLLQQLLAFLNAHWSDILAIILKLLGM